MKNIRQTNINIHRDSWVEINVGNLEHNINRAMSGGFESYNDSQNDSYNNDYYNKEINNDSYNNDYYENERQSPKKHDFVL